MSEDRVAFGAGAMNLQSCGLTGLRVQGVRLVRIGP